MYSIIKNGLAWVAKILLGFLVVITVVLLLFLLRAQFTEIKDVKEAAPSGAKWVNALDTQIHYQTHGDSTKPALVLVHGTGAWAGTWVSNTNALVAAGWYVVALDLPPFGYSQRFKGMDYSRPTQAKRILAAIQNLGINNATLLGHSYGGGPAAEAVMLDSSLISHLILVDAAIGLNEQPLQPCENTVIKQVASWRPLRTAMITVIGTNPWMSQTLLKKFVARKEVITEERTGIYQQPFNTRNFSASLGDWVYQFGLSCENSRSQIPASYAQLQTPLTLIWGAQDTITPLSQAKNLHQLNPKSRLFVLPGVGHIPQIEDPSQFNAALVKELRAIASGEF